MSDFAIIASGIERHYHHLMLRRDEPCLLVAFARMTLDSAATLVSKAEGPCDDTQSGHIIHTQTRSYRPVSSATHELVKTILM